jgi:hypothetical protein
VLIPGIGHYGVYCENSDYHSLILLLPMESTNRCSSFRVAASR